MPLNPNNNHQLINLILFKLVDLALLLKVILKHFENVIAT
jgi:hypothetical protein